MNTLIKIERHPPPRSRGALVLVLCGLLVWTLSLGHAMANSSSDMAPAADAGVAAALAAAPKASKSTADHSKFKELQGPFASGSEVTKACLSCHTEAGKQVMGTRHWTWEYTNPDTGQKLGKKTMLNSFCIGDRSNEAFCQSCHVGYGWKDDKFNFHDESKVDCLVCHNTGGYKKPAGMAGEVPTERTELPRVRANSSTRWTSRWWPNTLARPAPPTAAAATTTAVAATA